MDIMVDLETLATTADAVILSIGAVTFDPHSNEIGNDGFYTAVEMHAQMVMQRRISESTLKFWMEQGPEAKAVFADENKRTLHAALYELEKWVGPDFIGNIWSNGADFDIPMLAHAYTQMNIEPPWKFYNTRCVRTLKNLPRADRVPRPAFGVKHNALDDAIAQAMHVQAIMKTMKEGLIG